MKVYAEVKGDQLIRFPYTQGSLMEENPFTNYGIDPNIVQLFPLTETAIVNGYTLEPVTYIEQPIYDNLTQVCVQDSEPKLVDGVWTIGWTISDMTAEQLAAQDDAQRAANRSKAMTLLQETDWTEIPSVSNKSLTPHLTNYEDFIAYRTFLRNIAVRAPIDVVWPIKPQENWSV